MSSPVGHKRLCRACGVEAFADLAREDFGQHVELLRAVGVSLDEPGLHKLVYFGRPGAELDVWCQDDSSGPPQSFLWQLDDYLVRGAVGSEELQVHSKKYLMVPSRKKPGPTYRKLPPKIRAEIRRLFHWTMLNLSKEVPADIRVFLQGFK